MDDPPGYRNYFSSDHIGELTDEAIDAIHEHAQVCPKDPGWTFLIPWGGAVSRPTRPGPLANRDAAWVIHPGAFWQNPAHDGDAAALGAWVQGEAPPVHHRRCLAQLHGDEGHDRTEAAFGVENFRRLQAIKRRDDPENTFHANHNLSAV